MAIKLKIVLSCREINVDCHNVMIYTILHSDSNTQI